MYNGSELSRVKFGLWVSNSEPWGSRVPPLPPVYVLRDT